MSVREATGEDYLRSLCSTVPSHIMEGILLEPSELAVRSQSFEGTVLIADLVGFTPLCERLANAGNDGLSRLSALLNRLFETLLEDAIFPYGGYVVQFGGDSLTTFFRGPEDAIRATAAALSAQRLMFGELGRLVEGQSRELMLRVGLARGDIKLPVLGDLNRRAAVIAGSAASRALTMQHQAQPNAILADSSVVEPLGTDVEVVGRDSEGAVIRGLRDWPNHSPRRVDPELYRKDVERKVALLETFVPAWLASRLRSAPRGWRIDGELRRVVIVFADVWGIDGEAGSEEVALNISRTMLRAFRRYGGMPLKGDLSVKGHRMMVLFGLHQPSENDPERAILAALEATTRVRGFGSARNLEVGVRCAVHEGTVYFGAIGSDRLHDITVVGDAVNTTARAVNQARPFEVIATESVLEKAGSEFRASDRGPIRVKGLGEPVRLYVVHSPSQGKSHFARGRGRKRFRAGRVMESERLFQAVDNAMSGRGVVLGIAGETGSGKSSILGDVIDRWVKAGGVGVVGRCRYASSTIPLAPVVSMFENFLGIAGSDTEEQRRQRVQSVLSRYDLLDGARDLVGLLEPVRRADGGIDSRVDLGDSHAQERVLGSITRFLEQRFREEPLLYVVEDLHFADTLTLQLAMRLWALGRNWPFMLVGTYRPDPRLNDLRRTVDIEVELPNLTLAESTELVVNELAGDTVEAELNAFMWDRSAGNPGYLVELIRFFSDRELVQVRAGVITAPGGVKGLKDVVPESLAQIALAGLNHLGEVERRVIRVASTVGRRFDAALITQLTRDELDPQRVEAAIAVLKRERIISLDAPPATFVFRDDTTRAVAYGTMPDTERRVVHQRIADVLEALPDKDLSRSAAAIAHHRERAGSLPQALLWYERAARHATRSSLDRETLYLVDQWQAIRHQVEDGDKPSVLTEARMTMLKFLAVARQGIPKDTVEEGRKIDERLWEQFDDNARAAIDYWAADALIRLGRPERARERLFRAFESGAKEHLRSDAARLIARSYNHAHELDEARHWLDRATELAGDDGYRRVRIDLGVAYVLVGEGKLDAARDLYEDARRRARLRDHLLIAAIATSRLAHLDLLAARFDEAERSFEEAMMLDRAVGDWTKLARDLVGKGQSLLWRGRYDDALVPLERALGMARDLGDKLTLAACHVHLGLALAMVRDPLEGIRMVDEGARRAIRAGLRDAEVAADLHMLRIALAQRDDEAAKAAMRRCEVHRTSSQSPLFKKVFGDLQTMAGPFIA